MLIFNPRRIFAMRGIVKPNKHLINNGIGASTATNLLKSNVSYLKLEYLEKICGVLNCTPNDLLEWRPNPNAPIAPDHPLTTLARAETVTSLTELVKDMPIEKLARVETLLRELKNE